MADNAENEKNQDVREEQSGGDAAGATGAAEAFRNEVSSTQRDSVTATIGRSAGEAAIAGAASSALPQLELSTEEKDVGDKSKEGESASKNGDDSKDPHQIAKDLADAVKNGKPLDDAQKDIAKYMEKMMKAGMSEHEIRTWMGHLSNELSGRNTGLTNPDGSPMDIGVRLSGDGKDGFKVHIRTNELSKDEKEISSFDVPRPGEQPGQEKGEKHPNEIAKDIADAIKNGKPLDQAQKDVSDYIHKMMAAGMSEFEIRKWVGNLSNDLNRAGRNGGDSNTNHILLSGDGTEGYKVHFVQNALSNNEKELLTFRVPRR